MALNNIVVTKMKPGKVFMSSRDLGRMLRGLRRRPIVLLTFFNIIFKYSLNDKRLSRIKPNCFCKLASDTLLLLENQWWMVFFAYFSSKYYFLNLFNWIRIETHFTLLTVFNSFY